MKVNYNGYYGVDKVWQIQDVTNRAAISDAQQ